MADDNNDSNISSTDLIKLLPAAILLILLIAFGVANTEKTEVDFLFVEAEAPLILVLAATAVVGAMIAALLRWRRD